MGLSHCNPLKNLWVFSNRVSMPVFCISVSILLFTVLDHPCGLSDSISIFIPFLNSLFIPLYYLITFFKVFSGEEFLREWVMVIFSLILFLFQCTQHMLFISILCDISLLLLFLLLHLKRNYVRLIWSLLPCSLFIFEEMSSICD